MDSQVLYLMALALTKGLGPVSVRNLIAYCGSAKAVFESPKGKLLRAPGVGEHAVDLLRHSKALKRAEQELQFAEKSGIRVLHYLSSDYPEPTKYIHNAPLFLFVKGEIDLNAQPNIAIVGTRRATEYGRKLAREFAHCFAEKGLNVVSGLAYGIDIAAHRAVLEAEGKTTAVLAHGLDQLYPSTHHKYAQAMLHRGAWVSEYISGTKAEAMHFPARNRIISGLSRAVIVIEAGESGGALITARMALQQNREVYAIPGRINDPMSLGCNRLIRDHGAKLVTDPMEVLDDLQIQWQNHDDQSAQLELALAPPRIPLSADETKVMQVLAHGGVLMDDLSVQTGIPASRLNAILLNMEFKELLRQLPGKKFQRI
ncbi:MAG: DNA-processing protein DprA [Bacteroidota bacterium]